MSNQMLYYIMGASVGILILIIIVNMIPISYAKYVFEYTITVAEVIIEDV